MKENIKTKMDNIKNKIKEKKAEKPRDIITESLEDELGKEATFGLINSLNEKAKNAKALTDVLSELKSMFYDFQEVIIENKDNKEVLNKYLENLAIKYHNSNLGLARNIEEMVNDLKKHLSSPTDPIEVKGVPSFDYIKFSKILEKSMLDLVNKIVVPTDEEPNQTTINKDRNNRVTEIIDVYDNKTIKSTFTYENQGKTIKIVKSTTNE